MKPAHSLTLAEPQPAAETEFAGLMLQYHRRAGRVAAWALLKLMADASDDGASRRDLLLMVRRALAALTTSH